ncbi:MAG: FAD-binding oxidoreductase [Kineosporiaceae bacterium]
MSLSAAAHADLAAALADWRGVVGEQHVRDDCATLAAASTATFATTQRVTAVLRPGDRDQVAACLRVAQRHAVPVHPVSRGRNWGYGSRVPPRDGSVVLDLGRLTGITGYDPELGTVRVQTGVTQGQLHDFLRAHGDGHLMDPTGSTPDASVLANALERGFGHTPYADHADHLAGLEVVLPDGSVLRTGLAGTPGAAAAAAHRWAAGPALDGLFLQSRLGVVTSATVQLMRRPAAARSFVFSAAPGTGVADLVDALRPLRQTGTVGSAVHLANAYKVVSGLRRYPWDLTGGTTPLRPQALAPLAAGLGVGPWSGSGALYGSAAQVRDAARQVRRALRGRVATLRFLDDRRLALARALARRHLLPGTLGRGIDLVTPIHGLLMGRPSAHAIESAYWRTREPFDAARAPGRDPDRDGCGLLWVSPVLPLRGRDAAAVEGIVTRVTLGHDLEPVVSLTLLTPRSAIAVVSLLFDRTVADADEQAAACAADLTAELAAAGYHSYRPPGPARRDGTGLDEASARVVAAVRREVDPAGILSAGA